MPKFSIAGNLSPYDYPKYEHDYDSPQCTMGQQDYYEDDRNILTEISDNDYDPFGAYDDEG